MTMITSIFDVAIVVCSIVTIIISLAAITGIGSELVIKIIIKITTKFPILQYIIPAMLIIGIINAVMNA